MASDSDSGSSVSVPCEKSDFTLTYGADGRYINVTKVAIQNCLKGNLLIISDDDCYRSLIFGDPIYGVVKSLFVAHNGKKTLYKSGKILRYEFSPEEADFLRKTYHEPWQIMTISQALNKLREQQKELFLLGGSWEEEFTEQLMTLMYLQPTAHVLELGSNIGRVSMIAGLNLESPRTLVTMECDYRTSCILTCNCRCNYIDINIINGALSKRRLMQKKSTTASINTAAFTIPLKDHDVVPPDHNEISISNFVSLENTFNLQFDTLIIDCEGALTYILDDFPNMLKNIKCVIIENDFKTPEDQEKVDSAFRAHGMEVVFSHPCHYAHFPAKDRFHEVWIRKAAYPL